MRSFILNDESKKNSHGFYLLNDGGDFARFDSNPVMLDCHDLQKLLGAWRNRKIEGQLLTAEPEFDLDDSQAARRSGQVERGYLNGASCGIVIRAAEYRTGATGEQELYVTSWELFEASICTVPSNAGALTLKIYTDAGVAVDEKRIKLHVNQIVQLSLNTSKPKNMEKITLTPEALTALTLKSDADPSAVSAAVVHLSNSLKEAITKIANIEADARSEREQRAKNLVSLALKEGRITADKADGYEDFAIVNYDLAADTLNSLPAKTTFSDRTKALSLGTDRKDWTVFDWRAQDPEGLTQLSVSDPQTYKKVVTKLK